MQHTWPPRIVSLTYGTVRNKRKKRKKKKKDGNKTGMNESHKMQLNLEMPSSTFWSFPLKSAVMKLASSTIAIIALAVVGQVVPAFARVCALATLSWKILFLIFFLIYTGFLLPSRCWPCGAHGKYCEEWRAQVRVWNPCHMHLRKHPTLSPGGKCLTS